MFGLAVPAVSTFRDVFAVEVFGDEADIFERSPRRADYETASAAQGVFSRRCEGNVGALFAIAREDVPLTLFGGVVVVAVAKFGLPSFVLEVGFGVLSVRAVNLCR